MQVDVFVFGSYQGRIIVSKDSLLGKLALKDYKAISDDVKELCKYNLLVIPAESEVDAPERT